MRDEIHRYVTRAVVVGLGTLSACTLKSFHAGPTEAATPSFPSRDSGENRTVERRDARPDIDARGLRTVVIRSSVGVDGVSGCDGDPVVLPLIRFSASSASLDRKEDDALRKVAACTKRFPSLPLSIEGHTDRSERLADLQALSDERARAVRDRLVVLGADPVRLKPVGFAARKLLSRERSSRGGDMNRRVEFRVLSP